LKILHVITRLDMGGSAEAVLQLASAQKLGGHDVAVAYGLTTDHQDPSFFERAVIPGFYIPELVREISPFGDISAFLKIWSVIREYKPSVLHTHCFKAGVLGRLASRLTGCKAVVHSPHGHVFYSYLSPERTDYFVKVERFASKYCDRVLPLTDTEAEDYVRLKVAPREKMRTVPMGIYLGRFKKPNKARAEVRETLRIPADAPVVGWIGRLDLIKDCNTFISSYEHVAKEIPEVRYLIVGNGEERSALLQRAEAIGVKKIIMTGRRTDVPDLLGAMDALAVTSLNEGLGRVIVEAMSAGVPVAATAVGGVPDIIGGAGVMVPPREPEAMAAVLLKILKHKKFREELIEKGKARAERYSIETTVKVLEGIYKEILAAKGVGG